MWLALLSVRAVVHGPTFSQSNVLMQQLKTLEAENQHEASGWSLQYFPLPSKVSVTFTLFAWFPPPPSPALRHWWKELFIAQEVKFLHAPVKTWLGFFVFCFFWLFFVFFFWQELACSKLNPHHPMCRTGCWKLVHLWDWGTDLSLRLSATNWGRQTREIEVPAELRASLGLFYPWVWAGLLYGWSLI